MDAISKAAAAMGSRKTAKKATSSRENGKLGGAPAGKQRYFYALTDSFTGDDPREYTSGFANRKEPLAFTSRKDRDAWVSATRLQTAKAITRDQALSMIEWSAQDRGDVVKRVRVYGQSPDEPWTWTVLSKFTRSASRIEL